MVNFGVQVMTVVNKCIHFVGMRGDEYISACRVWGEPDFIHKVHDKRMYEEISKNDTVIFGIKHEMQIYNWDASSCF